MRSWFLLRVLPLLSIALLVCSAAVQISTNIRDQIPVGSTNYQFGCSLSVPSTLVLQDCESRKRPSFFQLFGSRGLHMNSVKYDWIFEPDLGNIHQSLRCRTTDDRAFCTYPSSSVFRVRCTFQRKTLITILHSILAGSPLGNCRYPLSTL